MDERDNDFGSGANAGGYGRQSGGYGRGSGFGPGGPSRVLDDVARLMTDVAGVAQGARREVETAMRAQVERLISGMDLVSRDEFETVREMAAKARMQNDELMARIEALEGASAKPAARKPAAKKAAKPAS